MFTLSYGFTLSIALMIFHVLESKWSGTLGTLPLWIFLNRFNFVFDLNGGSRAYNSYNSTPRDQISALKLYFLPSVISGGK